MISWGILTAAEINRWERARRAVHWRDYKVADDVFSVTLETPESLAEATVLWLTPTDLSDENDVVIRWGRRFAATTLPNEQSGSYRVETPRC